MKSRIYVVVFMVVIAALFGAGVTGINLSAQEKLEQNENLQMQKALVRLFGLGDVDALEPQEIDELVNTRIDRSEKRTDPETGWQFTLLKAYEDDAHQQLKAYAFRFRGLGFWAPIEGMLAVSPDLKKTVGCIILEQKETPGLGGRIEEPVFTRSFDEGLLITPPEKGTQFLYMGNGTEPEKGTPQYGRQFDAITGATQTSLAMERILNEHLARFNRAMRAEGGDS